MRRLSTWMALAVLCACASRADAQTSATITGIITDPSGAVVAGANISASTPERTVAAGTAGEDGRYRLEVPAGRYQLRAALAGFADHVAELDVAGDVERDIALELAAVGDSVVVTATRTAESRTHSTASVTVVSRQDLDATGARSLAEALRFVPGLAVESNGGEGALTALFSRGGESDYNLVLIDGVRANNNGGTFDFARISAEEVDRIEVVRGGQSALYGSDAMGAVVQIFTRRATPLDRPNLAGSVQAGSFNSWRGGLDVRGGAQRRLDYHGSFAYRRTDGPFAEVLPEDDRFDQAVVNGGLGVLLGDAATLRSGVRYSDADGRSVGQIAFGSRDTGTAYNTSDLSWHLDLNHRIAARATATATVSYFRNDSDSIDAIADPQRNLFAIMSGQPGAVFPRGPRLVRFIDAGAFALIQSGSQPLSAGQFIATTPFGIGDFPFTSEVRFQRPAFKYKADLGWGDGQTLSGGYEFEQEHDTLNDAFEIDNHALFVQQQFSARDRWFASLGVRVDNNSHFGTSVSPKLSAGGFLRPFGTGAISSVKVFTNVGKGIKNPLFGELFGSIFTDPNPGLEPERSRTVDAGTELTFASQRWRSTVTYFDNSYRDQVAFLSTGFGLDGRPDFINIAGSKARGLELEAALQRPLGGLTASISYSLVDTEVTATTSTSQQFQPGQPLLRRPRHAGVVRVGYRAGRAMLSLDARVVGDRHDAAFIGLAAVPSPGSPITAGRPIDITVNPGYTLLGIGGEYRLRDELSVFGRVDNVADELYEHALGYSGQPRSAAIGVRFSVGR